MRIQGETPHGASGQLCAWRGGGRGGRNPLRKRHPSINHQGPPPCTDAYLSRNLMHPFDIPFLGHTRPVGRERTREKETARLAQIGMESWKEPGQCQGPAASAVIKTQNPFPTGPGLFCAVPHRGAFIYRVNRNPKLSVLTFET